MKGGGSNFSTTKFKERTGTTVFLALCSALEPVQCGPEAAHPNGMLAHHPNMRGPAA